MSLDPFAKDVSTDSAPKDHKHFLRMCQLMTGIGFYLLLLASAFFLTNSAQLSSEEIRIAVAIGIGFGQLTMTAVWLTFGHSSQKTKDRIRRRRARDHGGLVFHHVRRH